MKTTGIITISFLVLLLVEAGCEQPQVGIRRIETPPKAVSDCNEASVYARYAPVDIEIVPLTEYTGAGVDAQEPSIKVYVSLLDSFGYQMKSPGLFRFELYERIPRSAEPKGRRITIWPNIDLTDVVENNRHWIDLTDVVENNHHWRDFLRAYEFSLPLDSVSGQSHILQVTCLCPNGKRLSAEFVLTQKK